MSQATFRLRPLGVGDLLDETVQLYRRHFLLFIGIGALLLVPLAVLQLLSQLILSDVRDFAVLMAASAVSTLVSGLAYVAMLLAMTYAVSEVYLGRRPTVRTAYAGGLKRLGAAIGLSILVFLGLALIAITLLGIPVAIYFGTAWALSLQALLLEGLGIRRAMGRSRSLVRGSWWRVLGITLLLSILVAVIQMAFSLPGGILQGVAQFSNPSGSGTAFALASVISALMGTAAQVIAGPIWYCGLVLLYYDLRIRKEGFDLELLAQGMEGTQ